MASHHAKNGTSVTTSPPSKPMACAARRARLRPRTLWRASQRSNRVLNTTFHATATAEDTTAATPARSTLLSENTARPMLVAAMAISS